MFKIVPIKNGQLDIDYMDLIEGIVINESQAIVLLKDSAENRDTWQDATEDDWNQAKAGISQPIQPPDMNQILGQFIVQQTLKNAELQQQLDTIGASIVQLLMK
jgi:hypothetical protein